MGVYVNPREESKEAFLEREGMHVAPPANLSEIPANKMLVCWKNNGFFSAVALIYNERELRAFNDSTDGRDTIFFLVNKSSLFSVIPSSDYNLLKEN